jgi:hypothetical protein
MRAQPGEQVPPAEAVAARLALLERVDPPPALHARILAALPAEPTPRQPWAAEMAERPSHRWVQWIAATAATVLLSLGLLGVARAGSRAADVPVAALADRPAAVVDEPAGGTYPGPSAPEGIPFDPFRPWSRGEPGGGP